MKITKLLLLLVAALAFACSDDDDDQSSLENQTLSFASNEQVIAAPTAMQSSENQEAQTALYWIENANAMSLYLSYMQVPSGATKSNDRITASNGRVNASGDVVVYTWASDDMAIAYQISETSDSYVFEVFIKITDIQPEWTKYFHAEEKKDRSSGFMNIYDAIDSDDPSVILLSYTWSRSGDMFTFTFSSPDENPEYEYSVTMVINEKTKAGSITYKTGGEKDFEMTWDAAGNGTYIYYDDKGQIEDEGTWTA